MTMASCFPNRLQNKIARVNGGDNFFDNEILIISCESWPATRPDFLPSILHEGSDNYISLPASAPDDTDYALISSWMLDRSI